MLVRLGTVNYARVAWDVISKGLLTIGPISDSQSVVPSLEPHVGNTASVQFEQSSGQDVPRGSDKSGGSSTLIVSILPCNHQF